VGKVEKIAKTSDIRIQLRVGLLPEIIYFPDLGINSQSETKIREDTTTMLLIFKA
jgi:hypothetical protein